MKICCSYKEFAPTKYQHQDTNKSYDKIVLVNKFPLYFLLLLFVVSCTSTNPRIGLQTGVSEFDNESWLSFVLYPNCGFLENTLKTTVYYREGNSAPILTFRHAGISNYLYNYSIEMKATSSDEVLVFIPNQWSWERDYKYNPAICVGGQCNQSSTDYWETLDYLDYENKFKAFLEQLKNADQVDGKIEWKYRTRSRDNSTNDVGTCYGCSKT